MNQTASATTGIAGIDHRPVRSAEDNVYQKITWRVMPIVLIGWIKGATGSIQMGLGALTALVIVGGLTILIGLPKSAVRVGAAADTTAH